MAYLNQARFMNKKLERQQAVSAVVVHNGVMYLSGILPVDDYGAVKNAGDFAAQLNDVYERLEYILEKLHVGLDNVLMETIFVTDLNSFQKHRDIRAQKYATEAPPAMSVIKVSELSFPDGMIELQVIAAAPNYTCKLNP